MESGLIKQIIRLAHRCGIKVEYPGSERGVGIYQALGQMELGDLPGEDVDPNDLIYEIALTDRENPGDSMLISHVRPIDKWKNVDRSTIKFNYRGTQGFYGLKAENADYNEHSISLEDGKITFLPILDSSESGYKELLGKGHITEYTIPHGHLAGKKGAKWHVESDHYNQMKRLMLNRFMNNIMEFTMGMYCHQDGKKREKSELAKLKPWEQKAQRQHLDIAYSDLVKTLHVIRESKGLALVRKEFLEPHQLHIVEGMLEEQFPFLTPLERWRKVIVPTKIMKKRLSDGVEGREKAAKNFSSFLAHSPRMKKIREQIGLPGFHHEEFLHAVDFCNNMERGKSPRRRL